MSSRYSRRRRVTAADVTSAIATLLGAIIIVLAVSFAIDAVLAQLALWVAGSWGVVSGFWHMFWTVWVLTTIISVSAGVANKSK